MNRYPPSRHGSVYLLVVIAMAIAGAVVLSSLEIASGRNTEAALVTESTQARHYAHSAIEYGISVIADDPTWRWTRGDGVWESNVTTDRGTLDLLATGVGGNSLKKEAWKPVILTGIGRVNNSRSMMQVQVGLQGQGVPDIGEVVFSNTGLAIWPLEDKSGNEKDDQVQGNRARFNDGIEKFRPGAVPGLGAASAPWFAGGSHVLMDIAAGYESIRTVSFWVWANSTSESQGVINRDATGFSNGSWACFIGTGRVFGYVESNGGPAAVSAPISARQWHHVVLTLEDSRGVLYLNGVEVGRTPTRSLGYWDASLNTEIIYAGASHSSSLPGSTTVSYPFTGSICNIVLMGQPLTATEVKQLFDGYPAPARYKVLADTWNRASD